MMKYPKEYLDEIKKRLKVSEVVGKFVNLKKRGKEFVGLSPFSNEKTPSFTVNDDKEFYHCFSTSEHGNIFDFLVKTQNFKFGEAVKHLAVQAGMPIYQFTKQDEIRDKEWKIYNNVLNDYAKLAQQNLKFSKSEEVINYIRKRKIAKEDLELFEIGHVEFNSNFYENLKIKYSKQDLEKSGLFYFDEKRNIFLERFRGRIIFPIKNISNSIIGFGGRSINQKNLAKYINSPETQFFKKGNNLFNIYYARKNKTDENCFIVEGYMDAITMNRFNLKNVVANLGTALTERQLELIWRYFDSPIICFDGDKSGQAAAIRSAEKLFPFLQEDKSIFFLFLPDGYDPDDLLNKKGKDYFGQLVKNKVSIYDFLWNYNYQITNKSDPGSLAQLEKKFRNLCKAVQNPTLSKFFLEFFKKKINQLTPHVNYNKNYSKFFSKKVLPLDRTKLANKNKENLSKRELKEYSLLYLLVTCPNEFLNDIEIISEINFSNPSLKNFSKEVINLLTSNSQNINLNAEINFDNPELSKIKENIKMIAPIKSIVDENTSKNSMVFLFKEVVDELKTIDFQESIRELEVKFEKNMDNATFQEIVNLKSKVKGN